MIFYLFIFFILGLSAILEILSNNKRFSQIVFSIIILFFFVLSFIRWETGTDWISYLSYFNNIKYPWDNLFDESNEFELGYAFLNNFVRTFTDSYTIFLLVEALILYFFLFISIKKFSFYPVFSLLIYYCMSLAGIFFVRQTLAMAILIYSIRYIIEKKKINFILIVILATLIHRTSIIFLLSYPIFYKYYSLKQILVYLCIFILIGFLMADLLLNHLANLGLGIISAKINAYLDLGSSENSTAFSAIGILIRGVLNRLFLIIIYMYMLNNKRKEDVLLNGIVNINLFGMILYIVLTPIAFSLGRVSAFFDIMQIFILPYLLRNKSIKSKCSLFVFFVLYFFFRLYTAVYAFPDLYIPYKTIFN